MQIGLEKLLASDPDVQDAVGTSASRGDNSNGIFPVQMPQGAPLPCLVYSRVAGHEIDTLDGRGELKVSRIQISAFGEHYSEAEAASSAAKDAFVGFRGALEDGTEIDAVFLVLENDSFEQVPKIYQVAFDVEVWYRNAGS